MLCLHRSNTRWWILFCYLAGTSSSYFGQLQRKSGDCKCFSHEGILHLWRTAQLVGRNWDGHEGEQVFNFVEHESLCSDFSDHYHHHHHGHLFFVSILVHYRRMDGQAFREPWPKGGDRWAWRSCKKPRKRIIIRWLRKYTFCRGAAAVLWWSGDQLWC